MIDEKKLIEDLKEYAHLSAGASVDTIKVAIKIVEEQPKVGEWIPCSERLPEENTNVIACFAHGTVTVLRYMGAGVFGGLYEYNTDVIIAWQPEPERYKGE